MSNSVKYRRTPIVKDNVNLTMCTQFYNHHYREQNKGTYIPDGLTKEQYAKFAKDVEEKKLKNSKKFYLGKKAETLTEWVLAEEKKGNVGKGLLSNHRLVKCKYEGWYTDESPV